MATGSAFIKHNKHFLQQFKAAHWFKLETEDHWSCIAHQNAEDMIKSTVTEETKFN